MSGDSITLTSTTDPLEAVQEALGIAPADRASEVVAEEVETPAVEAAPVEEAPAVETPTPETPAVAAAEVVAAAPGDDDDDDDGDVEDGVEVSAHKRARPGSKAQKRITQLVRERNDARGAAATNQVELEALRRRVEDIAAGRLPATEKTAEPAVEAKPTPDQFGTYEEYTEAVAEYSARKIAAEIFQNEVTNRTQAAQNTAAYQARQQAVQQYAERLVDAQAQHDDFDEVVSRPDIQISAAMQDGMVQSEIGPEIAYFLGKNPDEAKKLFALGNTMAAVKAFGKLESKVEAQLEAAEKEGAAAVVETPPAPKKKAAAAAAVVAAPVVKAVVAPAPTEHNPSSATNSAVPAPRVVVKATKAPDPITPSRGGEAASSVPMDQMDYQGYKAARNAQLRERAGFR